MPARQRLLLVDDHPIARSAIRAGLSVKGPQLAVDEVADLKSAIMLAKVQKFDLVLLDFKLPDSEGFSGIVRLQNALKKVPIAIISAFDQPHLIEASAAVGAAGFISKRDGLPEILRAIQLLLDRKVVFPTLLETSEALRELGQIFGRLSPAQKQVIVSTVRGQLNKQIAGELGKSEATIKSHLTAIYRKLGVGGRLEAVRLMQPLLKPQIDDQST